MDYDQDTGFINFTCGLLVGIAIGAGMAALTAPSSGKKTRKKIRRAAGDFAETAGDRWEELADEVKARVDEAVDGARRKLKG